MSVSPLSDEWVESLVASSTDREPTPGLDGTVTLAIGKKTKATIGIADGLVIGPASEPADIQVPFTAKLLDAWAAGEISLSVAYMKGDLKPVGPTRAILAFLSAFDDDKTRAAVR
ncbi:MAG: hypothetical protein ACI8TP_004504 [Acidimicrobiales bacterium]